MKLTTVEKSDIACALRMWSNYIETKDVSLSAQDAERMKKPIKALSTEQMKFVMELRELADKVSQSIYGPDQ